MRLQPALIAAIALAAGGCSMSAPRYGGAARVGARQQERIAPAPVTVTGETAPPGGVAVVREPPRTPSPAASLRGGEIDDHARFAEFVDYYRSVRGLLGANAPDLAERYRLVVTDADGATVPFARVVVRDRAGMLFAARSGADGSVPFFPGACDRPAGGDLWAEAALDGASTGRMIRRRASESPSVIRLSLPTRRARVAPRLDLHFLVDTTGSMGDEIHALTTTMRDVVGRIAALPEQPRVRFALTAYRDHGDAYVTRTTDFTADLDRFVATLGALSAAGGGDEPEALDEALAEALTVPSWDETGAVRLCFLIGDAPPQPTREARHQRDLPALRYRTAENARLAAARGVRIYPIAASGLNDTGEAIYRALALLTGGRFLFISYAGTTPHAVGPYVENDLDDLIVRAVREELGALALAPRDQEPSSLTPDR